LADPITDIIGDYQVFFAAQKDRLRARGIDISPYPLSHLAYRVGEYDRYLQVRGLLERHATANMENIWNGRPISLILLKEPLHVELDLTVDTIELIPPVHQRVYRMGLEHVGVVVGDAVDDFARTHRAALTGQQFQSDDFEPYYVLFEDFTHVKFYRYSLRAGAERQHGRSLEGFTHVEDWVPPVVRTATGGVDPRRTQ
jgi:predicted metalloenzyme YecM